ncbi:MAG: 23S rRNA (pseudouridine(1915)-N(3))-methyltransferase RlmH [Lachnospiraceae bacterium]|nr:23S rRNA (pseudouridine(1915)-N(3))-methyltransferase RlmH [Lachnospiraceae bacterium]
MKITILCVGKVKESYFRDGIAEYVKRLSKYAKVEIVEVADEKTPEHAGEKEELLIRQREGERLLKSWRGDAYTIVLAIEGKKLDSVSLAEKIEKLGISGESHIQFVIGGSLGLADEVMRRADEKLSFSDMTFPHQLMRLILCEQIYRSYRIIHHEPYHK